MPVLVDTDIGGDIDDANALAFLMASPGIELVGVTTVGAGGSARRRAEVAACLLEAGGHGHVPVSAGIDEPLLPNPMLLELPPTRILNAHDPSMSSASLDDRGAVDHILDAADTYGHELTLLSLGCLTNLAVAIRESSETVMRIGAIVAMAGAFERQVLETNVAIDPEAADIVFRSGLPIRAVGWEVARQLKMPVDVYGEHSVARSRVGERLALMAARYRDAYGADSMTLYDVTAAAAITDPQLFGFTDTEVHVELRGAHTRGMTVSATSEAFGAHSGGASISVAREVDSEAVRDAFVRRVLDRMWP